MTKLFHDIKIDTLRSRVNENIATFFLVVSSCHHRCAVGHLGTVYLELVVLTDSRLLQPTGCSLVIGKRLVLEGMKEGLSSRAPVLDLFLFQSWSTRIPT